MEVYWGEQFAPVWRNPRKNLGSGHEPAGEGVGAEPYRMKMSNWNANRLRESTEKYNEFSKEALTVLGGASYISSSRPLVV